MFNQQKTPSYFIRQTKSSTNQSPTATISRSSVHQSPKKEPRPEHSTKEDKPLFVEDDHVEESDTTCYKSVSVCTRWRWDDVFRTINTTDDEEFAGMVEELWQHALRFLDRYGVEVGEHWDELYEFADKTGILERHKQLLTRPGHSSEGDMKIMYYELIKMLIAYESHNDSPREQELTGRLQKYLNQRFLEDVEALKKKTSGTSNRDKEARPQEADVNGNSSNHLNNNNNNSNSNINLSSIERRLLKLEQEQHQLRKENKELKDANALLLVKLKPLIESHEENTEVQEIKLRFSELETQVKNLVMEQKLFNKLQLENNKHTDNQLLSQTDIIKIMKQRLDKHDEQLSLISHSDTDQNIALDKLRSSLNTLKCEMEDQEAAMEHLDNLEAYLKTHQEPLTETLENIMRLNQENKNLINKMQGSEQFAKPSGDNDVSSLQKQILSLQSDFEDFKVKVVKICSADGKKDELIDETDPCFIKTEKYLPDISNMMKSFEECRGKFSNLEINFESMKKDSTEMNDKNAILEDKLGKLIDQMNNLMIKIISMEEKMMKLEYSGKDLNNKLSNLEAADVFLQEADRMIIEKVSKIDTDMKKNDLKAYVNENILSVSKKFDQKYCDLTEQLLQHEREINKETQKIKEKIEDLSKLGNNSVSSINNNDHKAITHKRDAFTKETVQFTNNTETFGPQAEQQNLLGAFRGLTILIKSEGSVAEELIDVLGVYRVIESYNQRPLYKQEPGENYIYYSLTTGGWFIGTVIGHNHAWIRNVSSEASQLLWPHDVDQGWEYRDGFGDNWRVDQTLQVVSLVDIIGNNK